MPSAEFREMKRKYVEKHGYTLTIPGIEDVFHFGTEKPLTDQEKYHWKAKNWNFFDPDRYEEIKYMKKRRKDVFLAMLGSPSPYIFNARAAIITSIDDTQDALSTLSGIGTLLYMAGTAGVRNLIRGPLGWIMGSANALNFVNKMIVPERRMLAVKKSTEKATKNNLKSSQTKLSLKHKLQAAKTKDWEMVRLKRIQREMHGFRHGAWRGKVIEGLQTTDNVYGKGISLGAIMNLPYDLASGCVRGAMGQTVHIKKPDIDVGHWGRVARKLVRNWLAFEGIPEYYRKEEHHSPVAVFEYPAGAHTLIPDAEASAMHIGLFLAHQTIHMTADQIDPLTMDLSVSEIELKAPTPTNPLSLEVIEEAGDSPENGCTWPATGETWSNARDLIEQSSVNIIDNMNSYSSRNAHSVTGWAVSNHAINAALYSLENLAGTGTVEMEHNPSYRAINALQWLNFVLDGEVTSGQERIFTDWLQRCDDRNYTPNAREVIEFAERHCGINFVQMVSGSG
jgi:hypothetical protein